MGNYALFRPRDRENNFILSVAMTTVKMLFFVVLLIGVAALGLGIGLGKAWVDTSPMLDLDVLHSQSQDVVYLRQVWGADHRVQGLGKPHLRGIR